MQRKICFHCLEPGHRQHVCPIVPICHIQGCGRRHHYLLHGRKFPRIRRSNNQNTSSQAQNGTSANVIRPLISSQNDSTLTQPQTAADANMFRPVVVVRVKNLLTRVTRDVFALLDSGSGRDVICQSLIRSLKIPKMNKAMMDKTIDSTETCHRNLASLCMFPTFPLCREKFPNGPT